MKTILAITLIMYVSATAWAAEGAAPLPARVVPGNQDQLIDQMLTVSGLNRTLQRLPAQIASGLMQATLRAGANADEQQEMVKAIERALPRDAFVNHVSAALKKNYDEQRYAHFVQLLSGPVAIRMTALEASEPNPAEVQTFLADVSKRPLSPERIKLIQRIDEASQASTLLTKMTIASIEAGALSAGDDCPEVIAKIRKMIAKKLPEIDKANHSSTQVMLAFSYRDVSAADLDTYVKIYEDKDSRWAQDIAVAAIDEQFKSSMDQGSRAMKKVVQAHKHKKTMFAPKCGESESPNIDEPVQKQVKDEPVKERNVAKEQTSLAAATKSNVAAPDTKAAAADVKVAALEQNAAARHKAVRKVHRRTRPPGTDLRACLSLATSAEIIACTEK